jgi:hypothetical protein
MAARTIWGSGLIVLLASFSCDVRQCAGAQEAIKPLEPNKAKTIYTFPIQPGGKSLRFKVELDKASTVTGVSVSREGDSRPFQTLPSCMAAPGDQLTEDEVDLELLKHADLNFDGFEDLELLVYYIPHLDKRLYCIYLWDDKTSRYRFSKEISDVAVNLAPHPENKTISVHDDWQGGTWQESTYRWNEGKLELIEQNSLVLGGSEQGDKGCRFLFTCRRLAKGEMVTTLEKPVCTPEEIEDLPDCPGAAATQKPRVPAINTTPENKNE